MYFFLNLVSVAVRIILALEKRKGKIIEHFIQELMAGLGRSFNYFNCPCRLTSK